MVEVNSMEPGTVLICASFNRNVKLKIHRGTSGTMGTRGLQFRGIDYLIDFVDEKC